MVKIIVEIEESQGGKSIETRAYADGKPRSEFETQVQQMMVDGVCGLLATMKQVVQNYSVKRGNIPTPKLDR